jgi:hypothetical protein
MNSSAPGQSRRSAASLQTFEGSVNIRKDLSASILLIFALPRELSRHNKTSCGNSLVFIEVFRKVKVNVE